MSQLESDLAVIVKGVDEEQGRQLGYTVQAVILKLQEIAPELDFRRLHRVIVTTDFAAELAALSNQTASGNPITHTNEEYAKAVAQVLLLPTADNSHEIVVVLSSEIVSSLIDKQQTPEVRQWLFHVLHHEFGHVHDDNKKLDAMPTIWLRQHISGRKERILHALAEACWAEYIANYLASPTAEPISTNSMSKSFADALKRTKPAIDTEILAYRVHGDLEQLLETFGRHGEFLPKSAAYVLGYVDGLKKPLNEISTDAANSLSGSYFEPTWVAMHDALQQMRQSYPHDWKDLTIFKTLAEAMEWYYADMGLILSSVEGRGMYVSVPFRPETMVTNHLTRP